MVRLPRDATARFSLVLLDGSLCRARAATPLLG